MNLEVKIAIPTKPKKIQHLSDISLKTALIKAKTEENVMTSNCIKILNHDDELSSPLAEINQISNNRKNKKDKDKDKDITITIIVITNYTTLCFFRIIFIFFVFTNITYLIDFG